LGSGLACRLANSVPPDSASPPATPPSPVSYARSGRHTAAPQPPAAKANTCSPVSGSTPNRVEELANTTPPETSGAWMVSLGPSRSAVQVGRHAA
jgi:hypothetical protein